MSKCKYCFWQKLVCTTIRPTQLPFKELYNWDGAAEFVADYLNFETLDPSYEIVSVCIYDCFCDIFYYSTYVININYLTTVERYCLKKGNLNPFIF